MAAFASAPVAPEGRASKKHGALEKERKAA
jgi:hypothetical protein